MKGGVLVFLIWILSLNQVFALPVGILILSYDTFFFLFSGIIGIIISWIIYFFRLSLLSKILLFCILFVGIISGGIFFRYQEIKYRESIILGYENDINNAQLYDTYYDFGMLIQKYDKSIAFEDIKNKDDYYFIDIREKSEMKYQINDTSFNRIRFPDIVKNHKTIFKDIKKPIVVSCIDGERSRVVSSFLGGLGYESYYLDKGFHNFEISQQDDVHSDIDTCLSSPKQKIFVGIKDKDIRTIDIPYMQITEEDTTNIINYFISQGILNPKMDLGLLCESHKVLNCSNGRESLFILLKQLGFGKVCNLE